jgi:Protein of unknown function (DUF3141)
MTRKEEAGDEDDLIQPWVRLFTSEGTAEWMRRLHPLRLQYEMFGRANPFAAGIAPLAQRVREARQPVKEGNAFWQAQSVFAAWIEQSLNIYRDTRDVLLETALLSSAHETAIPRINIVVK